MNRNIKEIGKAILKKKIYIILITIIFAITGICYTLANVKFVATQKFLLGTSYNADISNTYKELIQGSTLMQEVIQNLGESISVEELSRLVEVNILPNTNMLEIKVIGDEEERIKSFSDEISKVFVTTVDRIYGNSEIYNVDSSDGYYNCGNVAIVGCYSLIGGFILSSLFFGICFLLDTKIKSYKDVENITGLKPLISIPNIKVISKKKLNIKNIRAHKSEVFKLLMTNIQFVNSNNLQSKSIMITSSNPFEGKTYVAINLAIEFAKVGKKVIVIDGDMRRGRIAKIFNLPNDLGFSNYLSNLDSNGNNINERITRFINDTEIKNLSVITSGNIPPNPTELMKTDKVQELIKDLKVFYDIVIFDTVSVLEAPEAVKLSEVCDLSLALSSYGNTKKEDLFISYEQLSNREGSVVGMVLNKMPERKFKRKLTAFNSKAKQNFDKMLHKIKIIFSKLKGVLKLFQIVIYGIRNLFGIIGIGFSKIQKIVINSINGIKVKSESVKDYIKSYKAKREKIKLIEAGSPIPDENNNIIKEVFEDKIAKLETNDEVEYRKKLESLKTNIDEKLEVKEEVAVKKIDTLKDTNQVKSKFDLIREQQEKGNDYEHNEKEDILSIDKQEELRKQEEIKRKEELIQKQRIEREKLEEKKRLEELKRQEEEKMHQAEMKRIQEEKERQAEIRQLEEKEKYEQEIKKHEEKIMQIVEHEPVNFENKEILTEEMIRQQVEMDEFARLVELEEEAKAEELRQKQELKNQKRQDRKEKMVKFKEEKKAQFQNMIYSIKTKREEKAEINSKKREILQEEKLKKREAKMEEKIKKEQQKNENRERIAKVKEEKRAFKELEKEKHREEVRIQEEIQEDNLYPKFKI